MAPSPALVEATIGVAARLMWLSRSPMLWRYADWLDRWGPTLTVAAEVTGVITEARRT